VTYEIDSSRALIRTRCSGATTLPEVVDHFRVLSADPALPEKANVLLDLSGVTSLPGADQLWTVVGTVGKLRHKLRFGCCGIVATGDALYGMMRMFAVFGRRQFEQLEVFRTVEEADNWLAAAWPVNR
jgi:hypothetical protein